MYDQRRELGADETAWPHRIRGCTSITSAAPSADGGLTLKIAPIWDGAAEETLEVDLVVAATGYRRDVHLDMLQETWGLLPVAGKDRSVDGWEVKAGEEKRRLETGRDYGVKFAEGAVQRGSGVWLQGCNEKTHGVSFPVSISIPSLTYDIRDVC